MSREMTHAEMLKDWDRLAAAASASEEHLGHLTAHRKQLESLAAQGRDVIQSQSELTAVRPEASKELPEAMAEGLLQSPCLPGSRTQVRPRGSQAGASG